MANVSNNLGVVYAEQGQLVKAVALLEESIDWLEPKLGVLHPDILALKSTLAEAFHKQGLDDKALSIFENIIGPVKTKMRDSAIGEQATGTLARLYDKRRNFEAAVEIRKEIVAFNRKKYGSEDIETFKALAALSTSYINAGDRAEGIELREQVVAAYNRIYGSDNPTTVAWKRSLESNYLRYQKCSEAIQIYKELLEIDETSGDLDQLEDTKLRLAHCFQRAKRYEEANQLRIAILENRKQRLGEHADTYKVMFHLAAGYRAAGQRELACDVYWEAVTMSEKLFGKADPETLKAKYFLGELLVKKDPATAIEVLTSAYESQKKLDSSSYLTYRMRSLLGEAQLLDGKIEDAKVNLLEADASLRDQGLKIPSIWRERVLSDSLKRLEKLAALTKNQELKERLEAEN